MRRFIAAVSFAALAFPALAYEDGPPRFKDRAPLEQTQPDRRPVGVRDPVPSAPGSAGMRAEVGKSTQASDAEAEPPVDPTSVPGPNTRSAPETRAPSSVKSRPRMDARMASVSPPQRSVRPIERRNSVSPEQHS